MSGDIKILIMIPFLKGWSPVDDQNFAFPQRSAEIIIVKDIVNETNDLYEQTTTYDFIYYFHVIL